jgi:superfamily I DNA and/or RNA helicase
LSGLSQEMLDDMSKITKWLDMDTSTKGGGSPKGTLDTLNVLTNTIRNWKKDVIWADLLGSAHIIFCTLASAGASIIKKSVAEVTDLVVDEAAASTEPEMYIPFHFRPQRLLAVGDPKQLPATVVSRLAEDHGMGKSLHERLMYDCNYKHIMLDVQYRMKPELSQFPSNHFYNGRLSNGANVVR